VRPEPTIILCALLLACSAPAAAAQAPTAATLSGEIGTLLDTTATQWASMTSPDGDFVNPFPADLARGHGSFAPPMLSYAVERAGQRLGARALVAAAERAWPRSVSPVNASAFDMIGAAYAYRTLTLGDARRAQLAGYMGQYGIPRNGLRCLMRRQCYSNLKLVDALAVLAITGAGIRSPDPAARLARPAAARAAAARVVNRRIPRVVDHATGIHIGSLWLRGTVLSDPPSDPLAYHALSAFMLSEAISELGAAAKRRARRVSRQTLDALAALVAPDGDASYLGRGQDQVWVPALAAAALADGARDNAATHPLRTARYLGAAQRAIWRLSALHASPRGLQLVPGASTRATADGIDGYAHTVAYNGLALFGLTEALDALAAIPGELIGKPAAERRLGVRDEDGSGLGVVGDGRVWLAVHRTPTNANDLRHDFGALVLKRRTPAGWVDLLAPRPLTLVTTDSGGPALLRGGVPITPTGFNIDAHAGRVSVDGGYRVGRRWVRRVHFSWRLTRGGARLRVSGAERGDRFRMLAFTPAGTGGHGPRTLLAAGARWRFDRPIRVARRHGYHSARVEQLDALEARFTAPKSGRFVVRIGI
jgi:hypothetical protein